MTWAEAAARSCGTGGEWHLYKEQTGQCPLVEEFRALIEELGTDLERKMVKAELLDKMKLACSGALTFGAGEDVDRMASEPDVLEIRWRIAVTVDDNARIMYRLYFSEPANFPTVLLALRWSRKAPGPASLVMQNSEIQIAHGRLILGAAWRWGLS